jgi:hypothetical protein
MLRFSCITRLNLKIIFCVVDLLYTKFIQENSQNMEARPILKRPFAICNPHRGFELRYR